MLCIYISSGRYDWCGDECPLSDFSSVFMTWCFTLVNDVCNELVDNSVWPHAHCRVRPQQPRLVRSLIWSQVLYRIGAERQVDGLAEVTQHTHCPVTARQLHVPLHAARGEHSLAWQEERNAQTDNKLYLIHPNLKELLPLPEEIKRRRWF